MFEPRLPLGAMLGQKVTNGADLRIAGFRSRQLLHDRLQMLRLFRSQRTDGVSNELRLFLVLKHFLSQHFLGRRSTRSKTGTDSLKKQRLLESGGFCWFFLRVGE